MTSVPADNVTPASGGRSDELAGGAGRSWLPRAPRWLLAVVLALVLVALAADRWQARQESTALVRCVERGQAQVQYADNRLGAILQYTSPLRTAATTAPRVRASLGGLVRTTAREQLPAVSAVRSGCAAVRVLPWHSAQVHARGLVLAYLEACREHLDAAAADLAVLGTPDRVRDQRRDEALRGLLGALSGSQAVRVRELLGGSVSP